MTPEGFIKKKIKDRFEEEFPLAFRFCPVQLGMGVPGLDIFYCINGYFVAIEAKAPGKKATPRQIITMEQITEAGGRAFVIDGKFALENAIECIKCL